MPAITAVMTAEIALRRAEEKLWRGGATPQDTKIARDELIRRLLLDSKLVRVADSKASQDALAFLQAMQLEYANAGGSPQAIFAARTAYINSVISDSLAARGPKTIAKLPKPMPLRTIKKLTKAEAAKQALDNAIAAKAPPNTIAALEKAADQAKKDETKAGAFGLLLATSPAWGLFLLRRFKLL